MVRARTRRQQWCSLTDGYGYHPLLTLTPPFIRSYDHFVGTEGPVLVLFGDYEDPASGAAHRGVTALRERWDGFVYAWRHLPMAEEHPNANGAALAAECAGAQDSFWAFHHVLLARQEALSVPDLLNYAAQIGIDVATLMEDMMDERHADRIVDNIRSAVDSGVRHAPAVFIEGVRWEGGTDPDALEGALRAALAG
ncbi:DSBA-like thioredoxin domain-containing protein [Solirubrobacter pauli]|uniref:DSBA-like thioredoxin domain-containing protein n=1 Tax=Solirubrobacter pauli TaxID=166793 RepID=A0A660LGZ3_9ACTN|nr:DSBA-like thioredoxin domain-containing protein [Solirubrobacter pauli]